MAASHKTRSARLGDRVHLHPHWQFRGTDVAARLPQQTPGALTGLLATRSEARIRRCAPLRTGRALRRQSHLGKLGLVRNLNGSQVANRRNLGQPAPADRIGRCSGNIRQGGCACVGSSLPTTQQSSPNLASSLWVHLCRSRAHRRAARRPPAAGSAVAAAIDACLGRRRCGPVMPAHREGDRAGTRCSGAGPHTARTANVLLAGAWGARGIFRVMCVSCRQAPTLRLRKCSSDA